MRRRWTRRTVKERFLEKVLTPDEQDCMLWTAYCSPKGYGQFWNGARLIMAHQFAYEMWVGPVPPGLELDHLCRIRRCVAPDHLEAVTHRENLLRGDGFAAQGAGKTHCLRGHPLTPDNLAKWNLARGERCCLACKRQHEHAKYRRARTERGSR